MKRRNAILTLFFDHPRLLLLSVALIVVSGLTALQVLPRMEDPELVGRYAVIFTPYPGADAERVEALVTENIEDELAELEEIHEINSTSRAGSSTVQVELLESVMDTDLAWSLVRDRLADVTPSFPRGAGVPELTEFKIAARTMIVSLTWRRDEPAPTGLLGRLAEQLEAELRGVPGTMDTELYGEAIEEIRVEIDSDRLAALGLTAGAVSRSIAASDAKLASGTWRGEAEELLIELQGELDSVERIAAVPLVDGERGRILRLGDIATIEKTLADPPSSRARVFGRDAVVVAARMQEGQRVDLWSRDAQERLDTFGERLPRGITLDPLFDQSEYTERRLGELFENLYLGAALVTLVVLFLMGWRSAVLIGSSLPLSVLMVFSGMRWLDIPLHQMSVSGLIIALGLLIDNAIVAVDEVRRHLDVGETPREAIAKVVRRLAVPLGGSTLTTTFAFLPLVLAEGGIGEFVGAMSVSVILAILSSLALALTVVPAMAGLLERFAGPPRPGGFLRHGFRPRTLARAWRAALGFLLPRPALGLGVSIVLPLLGLWGGSTLKEQFFPPADRDMVQIEVEFPRGTSLAETMARAMEVRERLLEDPKVVDTHWFAGESAPKFCYNQIEATEGSPNYAAAIVQLTDEHDLSSWMRRTQRELDELLPAGRVLIRLLEQGPPADAQVEVLLFGSDLGALTRAGDELRRELSASEGVLHTVASLRGVQPQLGLVLDESEVQLGGLTRSAVADRLQAALEGVVGGSLVEGTEELPVRVRFSGETRTDLDRLASMQVVLPGRGELAWAPLSSFGHFTLQPATAQITRRDRVRINAVQAWVEPGTLPADSLASFQSRLDESGYRLPAGVTSRIGGEAAERDDAVAKLAASTAVILVLMAATLVLSFNSFRLAAVIATVAGLSVGLSFGALWLFGYPFGFMAIVGTMGLVGVAINDSIVVLSAIRNDPKARLGDVEAVRDVVRGSTRHVLATTATTIAGFLPLFLSGGSFWPPVAVAIGGGVLGATLLALLLVPCAYRLVSCRRCAPIPVSAQLTEAPA